MRITFGEPAPHMIQSAQRAFLAVGARYLHSSPGGLSKNVEAGFAQQLLEYSPDALLLVGQDGSISFLNTAAERLFGYTRAQLLGADHSMLLAEASREDFHGVLAGLGTAADSRARFAGSGRRADGAELQVEITCSLVPAPAGAADVESSVVLSVRDAAQRHDHNAVRPPGAGSFPAAGGAGQTPGGDVLRRRTPEAPAALEKKISKMTSALLLYLPR